MRILFVVGGFAGPEREPWLMDDLVAGCLAAGHSIDVVIADAKNPRPRGESPGHASRLTLYSVGTQRRLASARSRMVEHVKIAWRLHTSAFKWLKSREKYDLTVYTSPAFISWALPRRARWAGLSRRNLLFLWDFFPVHQLEIGRLKPGWLSRPLKALERGAIVGADFTALMSPANVQFFRDYHRALTTQTLIVPPWSSAKRPANGRAHAPADQPLKVLFGGQLAKGRGVDTLLEAAAILSQRSEEFTVVIAGDGPERPALEDLLGRLKLPNVNFLGALPREEYRAVAGNADIGVAVTVPRVSAPSFPSKIVEYCALGLPVLVCTEPASDAGDLVVEYGAGFTAEAGDPHALAEMLSTAIDQHATGELAERALGASKLFDEKFSVSAIVNVIEATVDPEHFEDSRRRLC